MHHFGGGCQLGRTRATCNKVGSRRLSARYVPRCESLEARTLLSFGLDPTFGMGGQVQTALTASPGAQSIAVQPDGKILAVGSITNSTTGQDFAVVRYNADGSVDTSFGSGGEVTTDFAGRNDQAVGLALQPNGQIVVAGTSTPTSGKNGELAVARYNANGQLDLGFGSGGTVLSSALDGASSIGLEPDSRIVVGAATGLARLNPDGSFDTTFGSGGPAAGVASLPTGGTTINDLAIQSDGKIVVVGDFFHASTLSNGYFLARYSVNGSLDAGFAQGGVIAVFEPGGIIYHGFLTESLSQVALQPDGKIVAVGSQGCQGICSPVPPYAQTSPFEIRLNPDGTSDATFGGNGDQAVVIQPDGKIVTLGTGMNGGTILVRQNADGSPDLGFGPRGTVTAPFGGTLALQADGKIVVASGSGSLSLARFGPAPRIYAVGADAGGGPEVKVYDADTGALKLDFFAYDPNFRGGVRVAVGDANGDGVPDIITAPGPGGGPEVKVFDGVSGKVLMDFMAFDPNFTGGVYVAAGDVNGDGHADIIAGADAGGGPEVRVFSGADGSVLQSFFAYNPGFIGGVRVAAGDVFNTGIAAIITAPGLSGGPNVKVFDANGNVRQSFFAYDPNFTGGIYVAAADVDGDGHADIITGAGPGGGPNVKVFSGVDDTVLQSFFAYSPAFAGGVRVGALTTSAGTTELLTGAGPGGGPAVGVLSATGQTAVDSFFAYDPNFPGGVFVGGA
jgi:uncharacterized delta-60 repeat protein